MVANTEAVIIIEKEGELYCVRKNGQIKHYTLKEMKFQDYEKLYDVKNEN